MLALRPIYKWKAELFPQPPPPPPPPPPPLQLNSGWEHFFFFFFFFWVVVLLFRFISFRSIFFFSVSTFIGFLICCFCFVPCHWLASSIGGAATVFRLVIYYRHRFQQLPCVFHGQMPPTHFQRLISRKLKQRKNQQFTDGTGGEALPSGSVHVAWFNLQSWV